MGWSDLDVWIPGSVKRGARTHGAFDRPTEDRGRRVPAARQPRGPSGAPYGLASAQEVKHVGIVSPQPDPAFERQRSGAMRLLVQTSEGVALREVLPPSALQVGVDPGTAAERSVRQVAADLGLPDFTYEPGQGERGSASREVGDALIICGTRGLSIQVKTRTSISPVIKTETGRTDALVRRALRQARGSVRTLRREPMRLCNLRGRSRLIDGACIHWINVVILDHPSPPMIDFDPAEDGCDEQVVLLRRDWEFLFHQLGSAVAVIEYLARVAGDTSRLAQEPVRYYELAQSDNSVAPVSGSPGAGGRGHVGYPLLPLEPRSLRPGSPEWVADWLLRQLAAIEVPDDEYNRQAEMLAVMDRMPVSYRGELGKALLDQLEAVTSLPPARIGLRHRIVQERRIGTMFLVGAYGRGGPKAQVLFNERVMVHHQRMWSPSALADDVDTIGVLVTPVEGAPSDMATDFIHVRGDLGLAESELAAAEAQWANLS